MRQELQQQLVRRKLGPQQRRQKPQERQRGWQEQILQELQPHTIVPPRSKAPPHKAAPKKRKHEEVASSSSKVAKVAGSKSPAAAEATRPPLQLQATTSKSASSSSTHDVHMYQQPRTPEVEITDDHSRDSDSLPGTPCTDQGAGKEVEEEIEVLDFYLPQERYMSRLILAKCDVCQDTEEGPKVCVSAKTEKRLNPKNIIQETPDDEYPQFCGCPEDDLGRIFQEKRNYPDVWKAGWCQHCQAPLAQGWVHEPDPCHGGTEVCSFGPFVCRSPPDSEVLFAAHSIVDMDYEANRAHYDPPTTPVDYPQPNHGAPNSSGIAARTRAIRKELEMSGALCHWIKDLRTAEKQYRRHTHRGDRASMVQEAKTKIYDLFIRVSEWEWQRIHGEDEISKEVQARFALNAQAHADKIERVAQNLKSHNRESPKTS